jgi:uncharacterized alkaline shock family protein YloU
MSDLMDTGDALDTLAMVLDAAVEAVPGVLRLTAAEPTLMRAAREGVGVLLGTPDQSARVSVKRVRGAVAVHANIAVAAEHASPAVAQAVHHAIAELLPSADDAAAPSITVRVVDVVPSGSRD